MKIGASYFYEDALFYAYRKAYDSINQNIIIVCVCIFEESHGHAAKEAKLFKRIRL